jgi:DNA-binding NtrC family response regulator
MIGSSAAIQKTRKLVAAVAPSTAPVFITGESGTGKEVCAEAIHAASPRAGNPFIAINCAAIPRDLIESEIFGHLKGAFTGAISDREGAAAAADGGTLLLDEICEMDFALQSKLLRFLQTGTIQPVGSPQTRQVDIRVICATNRTPQREIAAGRLREDLYFRLHVLPIHLQPLRDRTDDIVELADWFLRLYSQEEGRNFTGISDEARAVLAAHHWPGNIRELQNIIRQAVVLHDGETLQPDMLTIGHTEDSLPGRTGTDLAAPGRQLWQIERDVIEATIARFSGSIPKAADALGISPSTIYRKREGWAARPC